MRTFHVLLATVALATAGCSVGPDFQPPAAALPDQWATSTEPRPLDARWWQNLGDDQLRQVVERTVQANLDLASASNRLAQSRSLLQVSGAQRVPALAGGGSYQRERNSSEGLNDPSGRDGQAPFELWSASLDASWEPDLWGRVRRSMEAAQAQVQVSQADRDALALSLAAQAASDYLRLRGVQAQLEVTRHNLSIAEQSLALTRTRFENGVTTHLDVANAAAQVATVQARVAPQEAEQTRLINALSYLQGLPPGALQAALGSPRPLASPSADVPMGVPSQLAQRRPDIRRAAAALHRATAEVGMAEADFYPRVTLGAGFGWQSLEGANLGDWEARDWHYGPTLYLPLFQGGRLTGTLALRQQQAQAAAIDYRRTVLAAWHEVASALSDYQAELRHYAALTEAVEQNSEAFKAANQRYREGATDYLNVLNVQRALLDTQSAQVASSTHVALDRVRLYKALAGGWPRQG
ncbi:MULTISPECIES: efflux transporter outer membrane subunit [unclassified Pseudomonas]|uniref:efflux transporter outer membrane subunit n=1 Tax=unclassified Pseudomonas TaxID=196821 RepID=UPI000BCEFCA9|nr:MULTISPECIES: efflux transporter outer membrane subunit [unclassified Pseudomonas]PVZ13522.1 NodT family efflux transporter outer membrane factor (OMF) lipoprotein [Pseudomonas sp. URIL14HWK12:I12]PVZ23828.1 NodT family efflux transporter outer membrane factor (OMF) lipoprotein [Pseudomonas sp. URIL14HWK12:I10]PVZ33533.1 NodT family efflux transporter outer membrane factor (OMF) lipoprotein [Pseudomonas sp. URIL14HWK12:I11]SNZ11941.1 efflux transporter, outer membrane factor (OMF) lipoprotei